MATSNKDLEINYLLCDLKYIHKGNSDIEKVIDELFHITRKQDWYYIELLGTLKSKSKALFDMREIASKNNFTVIRDAIDAIWLSLCSIYSKVELQFVKHTFNYIEDYLDSRIEEYGQESEGSNLLNKINNEIQKYKYAGSIETIKEMFDYLNKECGNYKTFDGDEEKTILSCLRELRLYLYNLL